MGFYASVWYNIKDYIQLAVVAERKTMKQIVFRADNEVLLDNGISGLREELGKRTKRPSSLVVHIYIGIADAAKALKVSSELSGAFPQAIVVGIVSNGEIENGHLLKQGIMVSVLIFDEANVTVSRYENVSTRPSQIGSAVCTLIDMTEDIRAAELLLQGKTVDETEIFREAQKCSPKVRIFGAYPLGHDMDNDDAFLIIRGEVCRDSLLVLTYAGQELFVDAAKTAGWNTLGHSFRVTKAKGNCMMEVDGETAYEIYNRYLQIPKDEHFMEGAFEFPVLLTNESGEEILRQPNALTEEGGLMLAGSVHAGMEMHLTYGNPSAIIEEVNRRCEEIRQFEPEAILLYSCAVRKIFWEDYVDIELEPFGQLAETAGFFTGGEIIRDMNTGKIFEHNITLLSIAMREGEKTGRKIEKVRVDDSPLKGQASLLRRLAKLVQATTEELQNAYGELMKMNEKLAVMATVDGLTGLYNRRETERLILEALARADAVGGVVSIVMIDLDRFKRVNDAYGHEAGDNVLKEIAGILKGLSNTAGGEYAGRWGGEEFFMILPGKELEEGYERAEETRKRIESHDFNGLKITASFGVVCATGKEDRRELFARVDGALYAAKERGRNRVVRAEDS